MSTLFTIIIFFLITLFIVISSLFRSVILLPIHATKNGWSNSLYKYKFSLLISVVFIFFEIANFTGFSWGGFQWVSKEEIINSAINYSYPNIYSNEADLKKDYSNFVPEVSYWDDWTGEVGNMFLNKMFGMKDYQVRLPDAVVIIEVDGKARFSRRCCDNCWCSPKIIPDHPKLGVVGTVQYGDPDYEVTKKFLCKMGGWFRRQDIYIWSLLFCF